MFYQWNLSQVHEIGFVLIDTNGIEVEGLGSSFTLELRKIGGIFEASQGTKAEISAGWYRYVNTAAEADTPGQVSIKVTGAGIIQQNLVAIVGDLQPNGVEFTYIITNTSNGLPIQGVEVLFSTDEAGLNIVWRGETDSFGTARDESDNLPRLDPGSYFVWRQKPGFSFSDPDLEVVS